MIILERLTKDKNRSDSLTYPLETLVDRDVWTRSCTHTSMGGIRREKLARRQSQIHCIEMQWKAGITKYNIRRIPDGIVCSEIETLH